MGTLLELRHIVLATPQTAAQQAFYGPIWGLRPLSAAQGGASYFAPAAPATGATEAFLVGLLPAPRPMLHHIGFAAADAPAVDGLARALERAGVEVVEGPGPLAEPGSGYGLRFLDCDGRCLEVAVPAPVRQALPPLPAYAGGPFQVHPSALNHVVLNTPDLDAAVAWYTERLGFRISDWSEHQMAFLRCNRRHHAIALNAAAHPSLNHVAYEVGNVDGVMRGMTALGRSGIRPIWGPGRHGPGNNIFCYFLDPAGFVVEYTAELAEIADEANYQPTVWQRREGLLDRWGTAGTPSLEARNAMAGQPDPGWHGLAALLPGSTA